MKLKEQWQIEKSERWFELKNNEVRQGFSQKVQNILKDFKPEIIDNLDSSLYYFGKSRAGKSIAITKQAINWHYTRYCVIKGGQPNFIFIKVPELLEKLRNLMNDTETKQEFIKSLKTIKLLILDDLGAYKMSDWAMEILYMIIDYRYEEMKTTYYTSNFSLEQLQEQMQDDRLVGRIKNDCKENIIEFVNEPYL